MRDRRLKGPEKPDGPNHISFEIVSDRRLKVGHTWYKAVNTSQAWYGYKNETTLIQACVTEQYMSRYRHSAIHKYRDSAQYRIHEMKYRK